MRRFLPKLTAVSILFATPVLAAPIPGSPCPNSDVRLYGTMLAQYATPTLDTTFTDFFGNSYRAGYNLVTGTLHIEKGITTNFGYEYVIARDRYDITGLPVGTVVPFTVNLDVNGFVQSAGYCGGAGCSGFFGARMFQGSASTEQSVSVGFIGRSDLVQTLQLPVSITAGTPILLEYQLYYFVQAGGDGYGGIGDATVHFTGLPAGASIISCQGYGAGGPTPVRATSWGRLKTIYR